MTNEVHRGPFTQLEEITITELQVAMARGELNARELAEMYIERIHALDQQGPQPAAVVPLLEQDFFEGALGDQLRVDEQLPEAQAGSDHPRAG